MNTDTQQAIKEFLAKGNTITVCPPAIAKGAVTSDITFWRRNAFERFRHVVQLDQLTNDSIKYQLDD
jgi:broad specificity polyphosphatase/5'/3'-nucleotidase SurE